MSALDSFRRVNALAEVCLRYGAIIHGLGAAVEGALDVADLPDEARGLLRAAMDDCDAQLVSVGDALKRALEDLPEGSEGLGL